MIWYSGGQGSDRPTIFILTVPYGGIKPPHPTLLSLYIVENEFPVPQSHQITGWGTQPLQLFNFQIIYLIIPSEASVSHVLHSQLCLRYVLYGFVWFCMVLYGFVWLSLIKRRCRKEENDTISYMCIFLTKNAKLYKKEIPSTVSLCTISNILLSFSKTF